MSVQTGQTIVASFTTRNPVTSQATNYTTATGTLIVAGVDNGATVTLTNVATGRYKASVTLPALTDGQSVEININATVNGYNDNLVIFQDLADALVSSRPTAVAIANEVEAQIIDDTDSEKVLEAIVNKINAMTDLDALTLAAIATSIRSELSTELDKINDFVDGDDGGVILSANQPNTEDATDEIAQEVNDVWDARNANLASPNEVDQEVLDRLEGIAGDIENLDDIAEVVAGIGNVTVNLVSAVNEDLTISIVQGDSYTDETGQALEWTWTIPDGVSLTDATVTFAATPLDDYNAETTPTPTLTKAGTISVAGSVATLTVELTKTETAALESVPPEDKYNYQYQLYLTLATAGLDVISVSDSAMSVTRKVRA